MHSIEISKLYPHPDNPRKDLGDLTELADSIKTNGIFQNLTVVPWNGAHPGADPAEEGQYTVIIGHRRLAAAKLAGLTTVPCVITDMTPKEQVATMLLENMQRSDLTIYEQAQGFQMMLDFGDSVDDIASKTGFSKSTVRHRVKLMDLDQKRFKESTERGGTIQDYIDLEKIKNVKTRNKLLEQIGTSNFSWALKNAIDEQEKPERKAALIAELETFAERIKSPNEKGKRLSYIDFFHGFKKDNFKKPADAKKEKYFFTVDQNSITLYKEEQKKAPKLTVEEKAFREREGQLKNLTTQAYESRLAFIENFSPAKAAKHIKIIQEAMTKSLLMGGWLDLKALLKKLDIEKPADTPEYEYLNADNTWNLISSAYHNQPERIMLIITYSRLGDGQSNKYYYARNWDNTIAHEKNNSLNILYDFLTGLGYEMSDEERALRNGTHELFEEKSAGEESVNA